MDISSVIHVCTFSFISSMSLSSSSAKSVRFFLLQVSKNFQVGHRSCVQCNAKHYSFRVCRTLFSVEFLWFNWVKISISVSTNKINISKQVTPTFWRICCARQITMGKTRRNQAHFVCFEKWTNPPPPSPTIRCVLGTTCVKCFSHFHYSQWRI